MTPPEAFKAYWVPISAMSVAVLGSVAALAAAPVQFSQMNLDQIDTSGMHKWSTVIMIGLAWLASAKWSRRIQRKTWTQLVLLLVPLSIALVAMDGYLTQQWSVQYAPQQEFRLLVGDQVQPQAALYQASKPCVTGDHVCLLKGFEGNSRLVWEKSGLEKRMWVIAVGRSAAYLTCVATLLALIMVLSAFPAKQTAAGNGTR